MDTPNIHSLLMAIRGLSNQITVRALSGKLGISYSTLARCKNGVWPRSITLDAMRGVLAECQERFFDGDGDAMARSLLLQLQGQGVDTAALQKLLACDGYAACMEELIGQAHESRPQQASHAEAASSEQAPSAVSDEDADPVNDVDPHAADAVTERAADAAPEAISETAEYETVAPTRSHDRYAQELMLLIPLPIILTMGIFNVSFASFYLWIVGHRAAFYVLSFGIALLPTVVGILVDAPITWHRYRREHADATFSLRDCARVAKYGAPEGIVEGAGRFNLTLPYLAYQPTCNILSALCYLALLACLFRLPGFDAYFVGHEWIEYLKVSVVAAYYLSYAFMMDECHRPLTGDPTSEVCENPDNYLPTRAHVWANTVHLVWTVSLLIVLLLSLFAYSAYAPRTIPTPALMIWPCAQGIAFFWFSSVSPYAVRTRATGIGLFVPGVVAVATGFAGLSLLCYRFSSATVVLCALCAASVIASVTWARVARKGELGPWLDAWSRARAYPLAVTITIFGLLALGFATFAFA